MTATIHILACAASPELPEAQQRQVATLRHAARFADAQMAALFGAVADAIESTVEPGPPMVFVEQMRWSPTVRAVVALAAQYGGAS